LLNLKSFNKVLIPNQYCFSQWQPAVILEAARNFSGKVSHYGRGDAASQIQVQMGRAEAHKICRTIPELLPHLALRRDAPEMVMAS